MRAYRRLLRLLPRGFAAKHGDDMAALFAELHAHASAHGRSAVLRLWCREGWDLLRTGIRLRLEARAASRVRSVRPAAVLRDEVRQAWRSLVRQPAFLVLAALTLALGIGSATAMYSALRAVVLDPLPYVNPDQLVVPWRTMGTGGAMITMDPVELDALRLGRDIFASIAEYSTGAVTITGHGEPRRVRVLEMTAALPSLLGLEPALGRTPTALETAGNGAHVVVLSHELWQSLYGGRSDVLGETLGADGESWTIIGVMPRRAPRPDGSPEPVDLWLPLAANDWNRVPIARLADGVTIERAAAYVDAIVHATARDATFGGTVVPVLGEGPLHDHLHVLMGAVLLLLLLAGVNVSSLMVHRALAREVESATRLALGAARSRLVLQVLLESVLVACAGGVLGAGFAHLLLQSLASVRPEQLAALAHIRIDAGVLMFCLAVSAVAGLLFGVLPALYAGRADARFTLGRVLRRTAGSQARFRWLLVSVQVALSFVLLATASLALSMLRDFNARDPGFRADGLVVVDIRLPSWRYEEDTARRLAFESMLAEVRRLPGVTAAALADGAPPRMQGMFGRVRVDDQPRNEDPIAFHSLAIDTGFLALLGQPLLAGRPFRPDDASSAERPVLLGESAATRLFGDTDVLGRQFSIEGSDPYTIVGIVADIRATGLGNVPWRPLAYWPLEHMRTQMTILARAAEPHPRLLLDVHDAVRRHEPDAIAEIATVPELLGATLARERFTTALLGLFAALALTLAAVGLYGLVSQLVVTRTHEIGIRIALGASVMSIVRLVSSRGLYAAAAGLVIGVPLMLFGARMLGERLPAMTGGAVGACVAAALVLLLTAIAASAIPGWRAARTDPRRAIDSV